MSGVPSAYSPSIVAYKLSVRVVASVRAYLEEICPYGFFERHAVTNHTMLP